MRILTEIPDEDIKRLDELAKQAGRSRASILREAIANYIAADANSGFEKYFGLWERHGSTIDGLAYERNLRDEWDRGDGNGPRNPARASESTRPRE